MVPVMELDVAQFSLHYDMFYDHQVVSGSLERPAINDLTMWPRTNDPQNYKLSSTPLRSYVNSLPRQTMVGIKDAELPSGVNFNTKTYFPSCPLKWNKSTEVDVNFDNLRINYYQE
jgi:hypothetical protein